METRDIFTPKSEKVLNLRQKESKNKSKKISDERIIYRNLKIRRSGIRKYKEDSVEKRRYGQCMFGLCPTS